MSSRVWSAVTAECIASIKPVDFLRSSLIQLIGLQSKTALKNFAIQLGDSNMARRCQLSGKKANNAMAVSHSHIRTKKLQEVNLQWKRLWWAEGNRFVRLRLSTKALKTVQSKGLAAYAKEAGVNLAKV
jgi:large subunit ribosomal protein L28